MDRPTNTVRRVPDMVEEVKSLDKPAEHVAGLVSTIVPPGPLKDLLSGTWLGHPLHPLLTDLPIGFWTSAWALDIIGGRSNRAAAQRLVGLGILSAIPTAAAGLSDWADTTREPRRVGFVHAIAMEIAVIAYVLSWRARRRGRYAKGVWWGMIGAGAATAGGALGGHLSFALGVGVDNNAFTTGGEWQPAGDDVVVHRDGDAVMAIGSRCSHRGGPLAEGEVSDGCVTCPWHESRFRFADGEVVRGPATRPQPVYETRVTDGQAVEVRRS
jgi:nitrite reductase/ring-hydroxylating ferredoxin subunit